MPGDTAKVLEVDGHPVLESCDPGEDLDLELTGRSESSLFLPNLWGYLVADAAGAVGPDEARCYAQHVIDELAYEDIIDPEGQAFSGDELPGHPRRRLRGLRQASSSGSALQSRSGLR